MTRPKRDTDTGAEQATTRKRGKRGQGRRRRRQIEQVAQERADAWRNGESVYWLTVELNGKVNRYETADPDRFVNDYKRGDEAYTAEPDRGLYAERRRVTARQGDPYFGRTSSAGRGT